MRESRHWTSTLLQSTGRVILDIDTGAAESAAGRLDIDAYFAGDDSAVAGLCAALEGS
jgi:hypothetical protein